METKNCPQCHKDFSKTFELPNNWKRKKYCSKECAREVRLTRQKGENRLCARCEQTKPNEEFYKSFSGQRQKWRRGIYCKLCLPIVQQERVWKHSYGISRKQFEDMLGEQNGVCDICGGPSTERRNFCVDHNHKTGKVRGLLCVRCNSLLGNAKDSIEILKQAIEYLNENE